MAGNIKVIEPEDNFQKVSKGIIFDRSVDPLTLGIYVKILVLGKEWDMNVKGLGKAFGVSDTKIRTALSVMERAGYLKRVRTKGEDGRFTGFDYHVGSTPFPDEERTDLCTTYSSILTKNHHSENPHDGNPILRKNHTSENRDDINRDKYQDKDNIKNKDNTQKREAAPQRFVKPTVDEVAQYCRDRNNTVDAEAFVAFYESNGWKVGRNPMRDWRQAVITWEKRQHEERKAQRRVQRQESIVESGIKVLDAINGTNYYEETYGKDYGEDYCKPF